MPWERKKKLQGKNNHYSLSKKLRLEGRSSEEFELILNNLSLEELIGLKLEIGSRYAANGKLFGLPLWHALVDIIRDGVLKFTLSITRTNIEAARFLGLNEHELFLLIKKHKIHEYFEQEKENE